MSNANSTLSRTSTGRIFSTSVVLKDEPQTLTNKTLTAPNISSIINTGTLTLPTDTDTLIGRNTTDTLKNKNLTSPTITGTGNIEGVFTGDLTGDVTGDLTGDVTGNVTGNVNGNVTGNVTGKADTADAWETPRTVTFSGGDVTGNFSIDGSANVSNVALTIGANSVELGADTTGNYVQTIATANASDISVTGGGTEAATATIGLVDSGVTADTYGDASSIPVLTIDAKGRITGAQNVAPTAPTLTIGDGNGATDNITVGTDTFNIEGGTGVTSTVGSNNVTLSIGQEVATTSNVTFSTVTATTFTGQVSDLSNHNTGDLTEADGINLYYTDARARAAVSVTDAGGDGSLSYDSSSGVITYTGPSANEVLAHFSASTGVNISSVGEISIGQAVDTNSDVTFNDVTVNGSLSTQDITATTVTANGNVIITGDLTVNGSTTSVNTTDLDIKDRIIRLNKDQTGTPTQDAGIEIERGDLANARFLWDETNDRWSTKDASNNFDGLEVGSGGIYLGTNGSSESILLKQGIINASGDIDTTDLDSLVIKGLADGGLEIDGDLTVLKSSDKRLKDNIISIEEPLEKIKKIGGYNYTWNELGEAHTMNKEGQRDVGVIAQEVEEIIPEAVKDKSNGYKAVQYEKIIPLLIECVKDQQIMIEKLQSEIETLKAFIPY